MQKTAKVPNLNLIFDRLTIGMIVSLCFIVILLLFSLLLYSIVQGETRTTGHELLAEVDDLQETTDDLQETIDVLSELSSEANPVKQDLGKLDNRLEQIDESLSIIEETIGEISNIDTSTLPELDSSPPSSQEIEDVTDSLNNIFLIVSWVIGLFSIVTAIVLMVTFSSLHIQRRVSLQQESP